MSDADIFLERGRTTVVQKLQLTTSEDGSHDNPDIELWPKWATIDLGGGKGSNSDGDIKLKNESGNPRIQLDAGGGGPQNEDTTRAYLDGDGGDLILGGNGTRGEINLHNIDDDAQPGIILQGGSETIPPLVKFWRNGTKGGTEIYPDHINMNRGEIGNVRSIDTGELDTARLSASELQSGNVGGMIDSDDEPTYYPGKITVKGDTGQGPEAQDTTVEIDGEYGSFKLGQKSVSDDDADMTFLPKWATMTLGGGAGSNSDGDIKLQDRDDNTRIHFTGGKGSIPNTVRVRADGRNADIRVGGNGQNGRVELVDADNNAAGAIRATSDGLELTDGDGNVGLQIESGGNVKVSGGSVDSL